MRFKREGRLVVWNDGLLNSLFERAVRGEHTADLAREAGVSSPALQKKWRVAGRKVKPARDVLYRELFAEYKAGKPIRAVTDSVFLSESAIKAAWGRMGLFRYSVRPAKFYHKLWQRHLAGERTRELAKEAGFSTSTLTGHWRRLGYKPHEHKRPDLRRARDSLYRRAFCLRQDGLYWKEIKQRVGYEGTALTLKNRVYAWRKRHKIGDDTPMDEIVSSDALALCDR